MVERNLAKVEVESSRLFSRSRFCKREALASLFAGLLIGAIANRLCNGLQIRLARFDSGSRLQKRGLACMQGLFFWARFGRSSVDAKQ